MMPISRPRVSAIVLALFSLLLTSCLLMPGRFMSTLDVRKDGRFSFAYTGEIHMLALSKLATEASDANATFKPAPCHKDDGLEERSCSAAEIVAQRNSWQEERRQAAEKRRQDAEAMKAMLGGIDPSNPRAAEDLAQRLRRQTGWKRVTYQGDGLFDVEFAISGRLDHDFTFPTIERLPMANAFVQIELRKDGTVRIDAPGFTAGSAGEPFRGMMQGVAAKNSGGPTFPEIDGRFTITTDGAILANNTDEGPQTDPSGQKLDWVVSMRSPAAPTALIRTGS
jgi:hypothetical protein